MDKDKRSDNHSQCSWMDMHQYISDLLTSGNQSKNTPDVTNAAWGTTTAAAGVPLGLKASSLQPLQGLEPVQERREAAPGRLIHPGASHRRAEARDRAEGGIEYGLDEHYACTCPGCPFFSSSSSFETLTPRQSLSSSQYSQASCQPKDLSMNMCSPDTTGPTSEQESRLSDRSQSDDADSGTQSQNQNPDTTPLRPSAGSLAHLSMFPCLCCHRGVQTCAHLVSSQESTDSPFSHTHAHHHFHHHHCPITSCVPCPQLAHSAQLSASIPYLSCRCSRTCPHVCHHQHRQTQQQEERGRPLLSLHPCMHCAASFPRPSQLLQHQRSEHAHKPSGFICTECGRAFNSHSNLRIHLNVHTGARPYSCTDCGKSFSQSGALKIHRRIHTGERPYSCDFCGRGFPHLAGVRAHMRTHTGEKPYSCSLCGKCFTQSGALKIHTRLHTGERPFICSLCGRGFSNRSGIRFHYRMVHGLSSEHDGEARAKPTGCSPGRPRTLRPPRVELASQNSPHRASPPNPLSSSEPISTNHGSIPLSGNESRSQAEAVGSLREGLPYGCEDCGLRFKDAPSRNRHQTLVHYSNEGREEENQGQRKEFSPSENVQNQSE
ncbi:zinc finger protein interacting with ribonucleoprotein K isoform X1 [Girardinichthys multiradiatus]|uniref:zinc finger protein interacting with ribonucleoprotein K isoform X1 n=1 Tax=Girardinichthys multiradiatus TaxID=208333 RepID=UPI001FABF704|nr:zinc finger protein interacting with ribonucleoprotein K isoform X1 [Girardinichthys multiradiatus]